MKLFKQTVLISLILGLFVITPIMVLAATSPGLGAARTYAILSSTYTNTTPGTTLNGNLGFTTGPAVTPTVNGSTNTSYSTAGTDQAVTLAALNSQPCTFTYGSVMDLASDTTHGPIGVYTPGVYCIGGAANIGGGGTITLSGSGTYIFRMTGALSTTSGSIVQLANGASACDVWWTPGAATTLGANSTFVGTNIDDSGITIGSTVGWIGRALSFGGTVSTASDTITVPACADTPINGSLSLTNTSTGTASNEVTFQLNLLGGIFAILLIGLLNLGRIQKFVKKTA